MNDNFEISNIDNYKYKFINKDPLDFAFLYISLIHKYLTFCVYNINNDIGYNLNKKNIILNGLNAILHIFLQCLLYTRNDELTLYNCQKAYCYYAEFINQLQGQTNENFTIKVNDAILFIYRKTIGNIDLKTKLNYKFNDENERNLFNIINRFCRMYNVILFNICNIISEDGFNSLTLIDDIITKNTYLFNKYFTYNNYEDIILLMKKIVDINKDSKTYLHIYDELEPQIIAYIDT